MTGLNGSLAHPEGLGDLTPEQLELLALLLQEEGVDVAQAALAPQPRPDGRAPLSYAQRRLWFLDQLTPGSAMYNIPAAVRLTGQLDVEALGRALNEVVRRHEALRTTFSVEADEPVQVIHPDLAVPLPLVDLRTAGRDRAAIEAAAQRVAVEDAMQPFNLAAGPLIRARLLRLADDEHILVTNTHHIVSDGWSVGVLVREMAALYAAFSGDAGAGLQPAPTPLPPLPVQYADFAIWQRQWLAGEKLQAQLAYWTSQLGEAPPVLQLPADRPRPAVPSARGASHTFHVPKALAAELTGLAQRAGATPFMALLAAFQTLLYRYTGQEDIAVGTPIANRGRAEIEGLIGFFVNTLVLRSRLTGEADRLTFRQLLARVRQTALDAYANQDVPFEMLVETLHPERDLSHTPFFQVMFALQNTPTEPARLPGLTLAQVQTHSGTTTFDMTLVMGETADGLSGAIEYDTDLFDATTIERLAGHFVTLLGGIAAHPDTPIARLPLMAPAERQQTLVTWNATAAPFPADRGIHQLFEAQVVRTPDAIALIYPGLDGPAAHPRAELTYAELNARANQLAHHLRSLGVGPESIVGLMTERSPEMLIGLLGILKAGGAYLPLDPAYPADRIAFMLADSGAQVLLTQQKLIADGRWQMADGRQQEASRSTQYAIRNTLRLDADWPTIARQPTFDIPHSTFYIPDSLAYVIYTSGSTGTPKGVGVPHRGVVNHNVAVAGRFGLGPGERVLQFATISFDAAVEEIFPALHTGATLVLRPDSVLVTGDELLRLIQQERITVLDFPTAYWRQWVQELALLGAVVPDHVRLVVVGGDAAAPETYATWLSLGSEHVTWLNTYGPTETSIISTWYEPPRDLRSWDPAAPLPIGRPLPNTQVYVLDRNLEPAPIGVPGELYIGGAGVTRGYLGRPELTAERFVPDPFANQRINESANLEGNHSPFHIPHSTFTSRLYRTGDLVRWRPDGNLEFLGRTDFQVKIRGLRIELGEVTAALAQLPGVTDCAVLAEERESGKRLVAYVALKPDAARDVAGVRAALGQRLPDYMLPSAYVLLDALPRTPSGKLDRRALPAPGLAEAEPGVMQVRPRTPVEEMLAAMWERVLAVPQVGVHDNFFDLGGHSLLATQLISRLRAAFEVELPVRALFEQPTVAGLAAAIEEARRQAQGAAAPPIRPMPRDGGALPLSFGQQRLWFLDQLEPGSPAYNIPDAVRIEGALDVAALRRSLNEIVRRHEVLRTTFPSADGIPQLGIAPELTLAVPVIDLSALPEQERAIAVQQHAAQEARQPFDLATGPLLRATLLHLGAEEHVALFTMHHIVSDGWSSSVLTREIAALYTAFCQGEATSPLPPLPVQYADFAYWQRNWLAGDVLKNQLDYWKSQLAALPPTLDLPTDRPRPAVQTSRGAHLTFSLPAELTAELKALSRRHDVTLFMTVLAGFQAVLSRYSGQEAFGIGTPIANRNRAEIEGLIGFFVNTLVLHADLSGTPTFRQLLARVRETALAAYAHQDLPFEMVVDALQPQRDLSHTPLFQVMFTLHSGGTSQAALELPGLRFNQLDVDTGVSPFDLTLTLGETADGLSGGAEYNPDLFDEATIRRMLGHLQALLASAVADPDAPVARLAMLSPAERDEIVGAWNATAAPVPSDLGMHQLFEAQAAARPDALALVQPPPPGTADPRQVFTYAELNARANQLAHHLQSLGVGPESIVGLMTERSPEMIIGLLGILKAGGAYLPLDPAYPADRLRFMIEDSGIRVLLTQARVLEAGGWQMADGRWQMADGRGAWRGTLVQVDADWPTIARQPAANMPHSTFHIPDSLAYLIYTSGSTGRPKGVMVQHRSAVNHNVTAARLFGLTPADRVLQFATISFDAAIEEIFPTWYAGGAVVLRPSGGILAPHEVFELVEAERLTVLDLPTAYWHELAHELERQGAAPASLRLVVAGGDKASAERLAAWQRVAPDVRWLNTYGPTEGTIIASSFEPPQGQTWPPAVEIPIGRPIANVKLYILDRHGEIVPVGVPGELHIGGAAVARGYLGRPELTAERFVPDPFEPVAGSRFQVEAGASPDGQPSNFQPANLQPAAFQPATRLYRTGDLTRWRPDGTIEFLGRADTQVKIRGFRVEPGEIEAALQQHPAVRECAVAVRQDDGTRKRLVAYAAPLAGHELTPTLLRAFLKERLPEYMAPAAYVILDALPRSPAGKVDRRHLPAPDQAFNEGPAGAAAASQPAHTPPQGAIEETLAGIWAQVLGVPKVGVHDNFFELGGDSILSIQVVARANQAGLRLTPRQLFEQPTVAGLATVAGQGPMVRAEQGPVTGSAPLTPIQRWFFEQRLADEHHWNQTLLLTVQAEGTAPDAKHLEAAVAALAAHHDALRLRFRRVGDEVEQHNAGPDGPSVFLRVDLAATPAAQRRAALEAEAARLQASLNLAEGPLVRVASFDLGPGEPGRLLIVVHHLAMDGVSWRIVLEDLQTAYRQAATGAPIRLPAKTTSFQTWARRLVVHARSEAVLAELPHWLEVARRPSEPLPVDFMPPAAAPNGAEASERNVQVTLTEAETQALLHQALPAFRAEINDVLLAGLAQALRTWTGSPQVLVELEGHGREEIAPDLDSSRTVGWFTTVFPVAFDLRGVRQPADAVRAVKDALRQVPNRGIGFGLLRYLADASEESAILQTMPQPEISFNYLGQLDPALNDEAAFRPAREDRGPDRSLRGGRIYPLEVNGGIMGGRLQLSLAYSEALHRRETIEKLGQDYAAALRAIITQGQAPDSPAEATLRPEDFPLAKLGQKDLNKVLSKLGKTGRNIR